jgi:hypothetical protein
MSLDSLRTDRITLDFHQPFQTSKQIEAEIVLMEILPEGFFPKAYTCTIAGRDDFVFVGEVDELHRNKKSLFLKNGMCVLYTYLIIVSRKEGQDQAEEFSKAMHSLLEALMVSSKIEVKEKMNSQASETRKLRAMITASHAREKNDESLDAIKNSNQQTQYKEPQNSHFELHL